jgi:arylsulfatase A-like enzyme
VDDGFRFFKWSHSPRNLWTLKDHDYAAWLVKQRADPAKVLALRHGRKDRAMAPSPEEDNVPPHLHHTTWAREAAMEFLADAREPWLLCLNTFEPHPPFNPPWEYYRRFDPREMPGPHFRESDLRTQADLAARGVDFQTVSQPPSAIGAMEIQAAYYAMIEQIDEQLGRILTFLQQRGALDNTLVLFMSDHGEMLGDHGLVQKGCRFYEGLVRVPLVWWWPPRLRAGLRSQALVELIDVMPTLLDIAKVQTPASVQGRSLLPILEGRGEPDRHRAFVRCEYLNSLDLPNATRATMYRDERHKLCLYHSAETGEMYDLETDPWEHDNLFETNRETRHRLVRRSFDAAIMAADLGPPRIMPY